MRSKMMQWESDPLFSAAEVVQDSADRMESTFRLLLHEQSLVQRDHTDTRVLSSIEHNQRDLTTALETAKWQLEDFEREVNLSALRDDSQKRQNAITRHKQFIEAIREQIIYAEQRLENISDAADGSYNENGSWDLEANEAKDKNHFQRSKLRGYCRITSIFGSLGNLLSVYWSRASRSFAKRLKDGEEQMHSPPSPEMQVSCRLKLLEQHGEMPHLIAYAAPLYRVLHHVYYILH